MDAWDPSFLRSLSSNHTVIVFDSRGIGNTTTGSKPYSMQLLANDAAGLLDALNIDKADVFGYSLGGFILSNLQLAIQKRLTGSYLLLQHVVEKMVYLHHLSL